MVIGHKKENVKIHSYPRYSSLVKCAAAGRSALNHVPSLYCSSVSLYLGDDLQTQEGISGRPTSHPGRSNFCEVSNFKPL